LIRHQATIEAALQQEEEVAALLARDTDICISERTFSPPDSEGLFRSRIKTKGRLLPDLVLQIWISE
jgi:hypothetical protein